MIADIIAGLCLLALGYIFGVSFSVGLKQAQQIAYNAANKESEYQKKIAYEAFKFYRDSLIDGDLELVVTSLNEMIEAYERHRK
jgi:hypothetical protein